MVKSQKPNIFVFLFAISKKTYTFARFSFFYRYYINSGICLIETLRYKEHIISCLAGLFLWVLSTEGQVFRPHLEGGLFGGASYYLGDINVRTHFYQPGIAAGAHVKYYFTAHHSFRFNVFYGQLKGNDLDFKVDYQQLRAHNFETALLDCHIGWEFNFLPYIRNRSKIAYSPYFFVGLGSSLILSSNTGMAEKHATIPFGVGFRYRHSEQISFGCEWGMRKTFTDKIDGLLNPGQDGSYSRWHNNDMYSFVGVYVAFKIFEQGGKCYGVQEQKTYK